MYAEFAEIYENLIKDDINYKEYADYILKICEDKNINFNNYLDLACGSGNLTFEIYKRFKKSYGIDLSSEMLCIASDKIVNRNFCPKFLRQDITEFSVKEKSDLITCCLDSTNYITDKNKVKKLLKNVYDNLNENGIYIFDINSYYKISNVLGNNIYTFDNDDVYYVWKNSFENDIVTMDLTFFLKEEDDIYSRVDETHMERGYKESEIEALISEAGFTSFEKYDNYTYNPVKEDTERIVYIIRK